ncbi:MAG: hypothetical protein ACPL3C_05185 [Pyrobaculum sp.]
MQVLDEGRAALKATYDSIMFIFNILEQEPGKILIEKGQGRMLLTRVPRAFSTARRVSPVGAPERLTVAGLGVFFMLLNRSPRD